MLELIRNVHAEPTALPRPDQLAIALLVVEGAKVLDVGCGDGALLKLLAEERGARARGMENDRAKAHACIARGLSVVQCDPEAGLADFPADAFDYVVFSHTLQQMRDPRAALREARRVGARVIVSIANAAHWRSRLRLLLGGRICAGNDGGPGCPWSLRDFAALAGGLRLTVERATPLSKGRPGAPFARSFLRANWFAEEAAFLLVG